VGGRKKEDAAHCAEATAKAFFRTVSAYRSMKRSSLAVWTAPGDVEKHPTALGEAHEAGKRLGL